MVGGSFRQYGIDHWRFFSMGKIFFLDVRKAYRLAAEATNTELCLNKLGIPTYSFAYDKGSQAATRSGIDEQGRGAGRASGLDRAKYVSSLIEEELAAPPAAAQRKFASEDLVGMYERPGTATTHARVREHPTSK
jgi:hypothetical protein